MLFSISAIHSLAILATADHEPTCVEIGFTILCNSDIVLIAKPSESVMFSISTSVRLIKALLPIFFWIEVTPAATKLSFTEQTSTNGGS